MELNTPVTFETAFNNLYLSNLVYNIKNHFSVDRLGVVAKFLDIGDLAEFQEFDAGDFDGDHTYDYVEFDCVAWSCCGEDGFEDTLEEAEATVRELLARNVIEAVNDGVFTAIDLYEHLLADAQPVTAGQAAAA